jgi:hypothetical protein
VRRRAIAVALVVGAIAACRGVVGIHDLELAEGGAGTKDGGDEGSAPPPIPPPNQPPPGDAGACKGSTNPPCIKCCRDQYPSANQQLDMIIHDCTCGGCGPAKCGSYCSGGAIDPSGCGPCQEESLHDAGCWPALDTCIHDGTCGKVGTCIAGCLR